jgi:uronate dehydrogenase
MPKRRTPRSLFELNPCGSHVFENRAKWRQRAIGTPVTGFSVVVGVLNRTARPLAIRAPNFLGIAPKTTLNSLRRRFFSETPPLEPAGKENLYHGGPLASGPLGNSGIGSMNMVNDAKKT